MQTNFSLQYPLILASNSPRRKEILSQAGFSFSVLPSDVDESFDDGISLEEVPAILSARKALALGDIHPNTLILAADTVVILEGKILNKPSTKLEAFDMLSQLSGKTHQVTTGITLKSPLGIQTKTDTSKVTFRSLAQWEIDWYVRGGSSMDKAGAYGVQDFIGMAGIASLEGSFYTVMGLPIFQVYEWLSPFILDAKQNSIPF
jgi:septum formation protein